MAEWSYSFTCHLPGQLIETSFSYGLHTLYRLQYFQISIGIWMSSGSLSRSGCFWGKICLFSLLEFEIRTLSRRAPCLDPDFKFHVALCTSFFLCRSPCTVRTGMHLRVKVKIKFTLEQAMKTQNGGGYKTVLLFNLGVRCRWLVNVTPRPLYPREAFKGTLNRTLLSTWAVVGI